MTRFEIERKVTSMLRNYTDSNEKVDMLSPYDIPAEELDLDSLDTASLLQEIEEKFCIRMSNTLAERFGKLRLNEIVSEIKFQTDRKAG